MLQGICIAIGCLCLLYYVIITVYAGIRADFSWIWLLAGGGFLTLAWLIRMAGQNPHSIWSAAKGVCLAAAAASCCLIICLSALVISTMSAKGSSQLDYVVVLGAQVKGSVPSRALKKRLDTALEYAQKNTDTILILSGGQGQGEDISEALCMQEYLLEHGIREDRMILEDQSVNTRENLLFSSRLTGCEKHRTGVLSNNFHVYRALKLAEELGYEKAEGIAAPSDMVMQVHYVVREAFALVKEVLRRSFF